MHHDTTIQQLGGGKIFAMAFDRREVIGGDRDLRLKIAHALTRLIPGKPTHVLITLADDDTYTVDLVKVDRKVGALVKLATTEMVYDDSLKTTVESMTGLRLSL